MLQVSMPFSLLQYHLKFLILESGNIFYYEYTL